MFQEYYSSSVPFAGSTGIPAVGTCAMGILLMGSPIVLGPLIRYPQYKRTAIATGLVIMSSSLAMGSLCKTVPQLIATQGVLYGIGGAITYNPIVQLLDEWFIVRKGLAFGIMWAGTGLGGVIVPLILQFLLDKYGFRTTLRVWAALLFGISAPVLWFLKPRIPVSATGRPRLTFNFLKEKSFWILQLGNFIQSLGFFVPSIYLPTYVKQLGYEGTISALPIVLLNLAAVFGSVTMGTIVDRYHVTTGIFISTLGAVIAVFLMWGFSTSLAPLLTFSFMYGLFAGSFTITWPGILMAVQRRTGQMESPMIYSFLSFGRGFGNVISGPVSDALLKSVTLGGIGLYGTPYGSLCYLWWDRSLGEKSRMVVTCSIKCR
jgi:MFS family permease